MSSRRAVIIAATTALVTPIALSASHAATAGGNGRACGRWMHVHQAPQRRAHELLAVMDLDQKVHMVSQTESAASGGSVGFVSAIPSLCIPELVLNDAGSGLADAQLNVTAYPAGIAQAAAWDPVMSRRVGASLGEEAYRKGIDVLLGPDVNIARVPLNGRTSEAFGEDPYLAGQTAAAFIRGVQSRHVIATVKHYDANNQETNRQTIDERISARALKEIYQPAFRAAIAQGHAGAVMCAYNRLNGAYACQNRKLIRHYLDRQMRFPGFVMSDWGATHSTVRSARAGLDMEMGSSPTQRYYGQALKTAVQQGRVSRHVLDDMVLRVLRSMFAVGLFDHPAVAATRGYSRYVDTPANRRVALRAAAAGAVLLKNKHRTLPITGHGRTIALIGVDAGPLAEGASQAGGSVHVDGARLVTPLQSLEQRARAAGDTLVYNDGSNVRSAAAVAKSSDVAIVYAGYDEAEGADQPNLGYNQGLCFGSCETTRANSDALIHAVARANPRTAVVLDTGGPVVMPWLRSVRSILETWYPGEEDGPAAAALLFGDVDPGGKLPITFPKSMAQLPTRTHAEYPGVNGTVHYREALRVGYRWYDAEGIRPLFPFGFGLSYTRFRFDRLRVRHGGCGVAVSYRIRNVGGRAGSEVGQVYVTDPPAAHEPSQQLEAYQKVRLRAGASREVRTCLTRSAFRYWSVARARWRVAPGRYAIRVGDSSRGHALHATTWVG